MAQPTVIVHTMTIQTADQFPTVLDYLKDLVPGSLPRSMEILLRGGIDDEFFHHLPAGLLNARPARPLEFSPNINPTDYTSYGTRHIWINMGALCVYITGVEMPPLCVYGPNRPFMKKFPKCIVPVAGVDYGSKFTGKKTTACANHQYDAEWSRCRAGGTPVLPGEQNAVAQAPTAVAGSSQSAGTQAGDMQPSNGQQFSHGQTPSHGILGGPHDGAHHSDGAGRGDFSVPSEIRNSSAQAVAFPPLGSGYTVLQASGIQAPVVPASSHQASAYQAARQPSSFPASSYQGAVLPDGLRSTHMDPMLGQSPAASQMFRPSDSINQDRVFSDRMLRPLVSFNEEYDRQQESRRHDGSGRSSFESDPRQMVDTSYILPQTFPGQDPTVPQAVHESAAFLQAPPGSNNPHESRFQQVGPMQQGRPQQVSSSYARPSIQQTISLARSSLQGRHPAPSQQHGTIAPELLGGAQQQPDDNEQRNHNMYDSEDEDMEV